MSTMQAEFDALISEAKEWDDTSTALDTAAHTVSGLPLSAAQFSFISFLTGVDSSYAQGRQHVQDVLTAGRDETHKIAEALRQVVKDFHSTDETVREQVIKNWVPE